MKREEEDTASAARDGSLVSRLLLDRGGGFEQGPPLLCPITPGVFAVEFRLPGGPPVRAVCWKPITTKGCRCRVDAVETDGDSRGIAWRNTAWSAEGFDDFLDVEAQYTLEGRFEAATWVRIRGELRLPDVQQLMRDLEKSRLHADRQRRLALQAWRETLKARRRSAHVAVNARREVASIRGSLTWRLTSPLRALLDPILSRLRPPEMPYNDLELEPELHGPSGLEEGDDAAALLGSADVALMSGPAGSVSVAIPVYNGARFLAETIESVLRQTHPPTEVVLVDDCSTDSSVETIQAFAARDPRVRLVRNERNLGMVANWNRCLELCTGDWIKVMGQDDRLEPECLGTMLAANAAGNDLVLSLREYSFEQGVPRLLWYAYRYELPTLETLGVPPGNVTPAQMAEAITLAPPCANILGEPVCGLFRRSRLADLGVYKPALRQVVDYEFWLRFALAGPITFVDQPLAIFRVHAGSATQANLADRLKGVHIENAILLVELLEDELFAEGRRQHPPLVAFLREALIAETGTIRRLARRSPQGAETLRRAQQEYPALARWCHVSPTLSDRVRTLGVHATRARRGVAALVGSWVRK